MYIQKLLFVALVSLTFVVNRVSSYCQCGYRHEVDTLVGTTNAVERDLVVHGSYPDRIADHRIVEHLNLNHGILPYLMISL